MNNNKLVFLIKTFTPKEMEQLKEYLSCSFFNKNADVIKLFNELTKAYPKFSPTQISKVELYKKVFSSSPFVEQKMYDVVSELYQQTENFLALGKFNKSKTLKKQFALEELRSRKQYRMFNITRNALDKQLNKQIYRNDQYFHEKYLLEAETDYYFLELAERKENKSLQNKVEFLDLFYFSAKLKDVCEMLNRQNIVKANYSYNMVDEMCDYIERHYSTFREVPSVAIYYQIYLTLIAPAVEAHYFTLVELIKESIQLFPATEASGIYAHAQNYCIRKINIGDKKYLELIFELYQEQSKKEMLYAGKFISHLDFKNVVTVGLRLNEFEWTLNFIEHYGKKISPEFRQDAYYFNMACYHFEKNEYKACLKLLNNTNFNDVFYNLGTRSLLLRIYYEQEDTDALYSLLESLRLYVTRNKLVSAYQQEIYLNLIRLTKKMSQLRLLMPKKKTQRFLLELDQLQQRVGNKNTANSTWLISQIDSLRE